MDDTFLDDLDEIYIKYGYEPRKNFQNRVYLFTKSIYNGADIIKNSAIENIEELRKQYYDLGYAVKVREFASIQDAEDTLFKDFFKANEVLVNLKRNYTRFVSNLMENLPEGAVYQYILSPYDMTEYNYSTDDNIVTNIHDSNKENSLIKSIVNKLNKNTGPLLIIIEAAAGYGKTCTAYEIMKEFISISSDKIPFFTELSRDRKATIFKHILQFEIEEQFSNRVDSNVVIEQIKKGRIPLIIDGFDELISKDFSFSSSQFEQVESMLSTIVDLLKDNAKIIITSRKTAIFNSEEFHNWMLDREIKYTLNTITISEPLIENWLSKERLDIIKKYNFPVDQISNPVLLTYLRYINEDELTKMIIEKKSIVDMYLNFLLIREQKRQNLLLEPDIQLKIFRKLVRFFTEFDIKSESKNFIKDIFLEYDRKVLEETRKKYLPENRPRIDQLADILTNHAFLDRKDNNNIGIVNEFVLGTFIADNLILGKYQKYDIDFYNKISQSFSLLAVQAYQVQPQDKKEKLWDVFNNFDFPYEPQFFFSIDVAFKNEIIRDYQDTTLIGFEIKNINFIKNNQFNSVIYTNCTFVNCIFDLQSFNNSSFVNCRFYDCKAMDNTSYSDEFFTIFGGTDNNDFVKKIYNSEIFSSDREVNLEEEILSLYFKKGNIKPRHRQLSQIKIELLEYDNKSISKTIHKLETEGFIQINGDLSYLTKKGIALFNDKYRKY